MNSIPQMMKAIVIEQKGQLPVFKQIPIPKPDQKQVLIKIDSAPINPSDISFIRGAYSSQKSYPCVAGFEGSGTVIECGENMKDLIGKRVAFTVISNTLPYGTYSEYTIVDASSCFQIDDQISLQQAACTFVNPLSVIGMLQIVKANNSKAVVHTAAASALGRMFVRYFQNNGIKVINVVRRQEQIEILKSEGAEYILDQNDPDFFKQIHELSLNLDAKIFFDPISGDLTGKILEQMPYGTTAYLYGALSGKNVGSITISDLIFQKKSVQGFWLTDWLNTLSTQQRESYMQELNILLKTDLTTQISKEYSIEQFNEGLQFYKKNMSEGKVLIRSFLEQI